MQLAIGSDERNHVTDAVIQSLRDAGHNLTLFGPLKGDDGVWPNIAQQVAEAVASHVVDEGILFCWTGTGVSIVANKVPGIRAALCADSETARGARLWNNANVLCLSLRRITEALAREILEDWFSTTYQPNPVDDACLAKVAQLESKYSAL